MKLGIILIILVIYENETLLHTSKTLLLKSNLQRDLHFDANDIYGKSVSIFDPPLECERNIPLSHSFSLSPVTLEKLFLRDQCRVNSHTPYWTHRTRTRTFKLLLPLNKNNKFNEFDGGRHRQRSVVTFNYDLLLRSRCSRMLPVELFVETVKIDWIYCPTDSTNQ